MPARLFTAKNAANNNAFSPSAVLSSKGLPLSLSALVNKSLHTNIEGDPFIWSASVIYSY